MLRALAFFITAMFFSIGTLAKPKAIPADWSKEAVRMTGESDVVRERALARLRKMPQLKEILRQELNGPKKALALDVISSLEIKELLPDLLSAAREDQTGFVYLTLNNLMTGKNRGDLVKFYKKQLLCRFLCSVSGPSQVVIVETLARLNEDVELEDLQTLFQKSDWPEVQGAVLDYARYAVLKHKKEQYAPLLKLGLAAKATQLQEQARSVYAEMPRSQRTKLLEGLVLNPLPPAIVVPEDIQVRVAFGYKDARPARFVGDRYERLFLIQNLIKPCESESEFSCGFERDQKDLNYFMKPIKNTQGEKNWIRLNITASAAGPDDEDNRTNPYQSHLSKISQQNFLDGLKSAEAVFYVGHSRDGGGPDFRPPRLTKQQHVAYEWYRKKEPGFKSLLATLKPDKIKRSPFKLGLLSCASTQHFEKRIRQTTQSAQTLTVPKLLYYSEALEMLSKELSSFIQLKTNGSGPKS